MNRLSPTRLGLLFTVIVAALALLVGRLAIIQLWHGPSYAGQALANVVREVPLPEIRGRILDSNGVVLAGNRAALSIALEDPRTPPERAAVLGEALGLTPQAIRAASAHRAGRSYDPAVLLVDVDAATYTTIAERGSDYPELVLGVTVVREYPLGPGAAHVTGYLGEVGPGDLARFPGLYAMGDRRGLTGVEAACDWVLRGQPGRATYEVDAAGDPVRRLGIVESRPGLDVRLTLDSRLQVAAYTTLLASLQALPAGGRAGEAGDTGRPGGAAVALDPRTGAVLALVSLPSFDPGLFAMPAPSGTVSGLTGDPSRPFLNRAAQGLYGPGSTLKVVTAVAALEEGVTTTSEAVFDSGRHPVIPKRCWRAGGHGSVRLREAVMGSCNVYFYEMGLRLGIERLAAWARQFGLGRPTGLDLFQAHGSLGPGVTGPPSAVEEPSGMVSDGASKAAAFPEDPTFWPAEVMDAAIGEGLHAYTPLQLAVAVAAVANGGTIWHPYLIDALVEPSSGRVIVGAAPSSSGQLTASPEVLAVVRQAMAAAVMEVHPFAGTGTGVFGPAFEARWGIRVAGKTGTHERPAGDPRADDGLFICFAPADDPALVVVVVVEQGVSGSRSAAPVARAIIEAWLEGLDPGLVPGLDP